MKSNTKLHLLKLITASLFTAIIAVLSQISIITPVGIPITFQVFAIALCGYILGVKWGFGSVLAYILLGIVGLPVFSGFKGGIGVLFELTGGYIIGFIPLVLFCGLAKHFKRKFVAVAISFIGLFLCHAIGIVVLSLISNTPLVSALVSIYVPLTVKDIIFQSIAYFLATYINKKTNFLP